MQKIKPNLPKLILPPANVGMEYIAPPSVSPSPSPSPIPHIVDYDVEVDPDNMVIRGSPITPSPSPSPQPPQDYNVEVDPDNAVIRGGGGNSAVFDFDSINYDDYHQQGSRRVSSASSSMSSNVAAVNLANDMPAYNEDLTSYKSHT